MDYATFLDEWRSDAPQVLVHTSGSTGKPKPIWVDKSRMRASAQITCRFLGLQSGDTALLCLPVDYIAGKMMVVRSEECHLRLIAEEPSGHPLRHVSEPITFAAMVPLQVFQSLQDPVEAARLRAICHLIIGGGAIDEHLEQMLVSFPHAVWSTYGMTETLSHIALRRVNGPKASLWYTPFDSVRVSLNADQCLVIDAPRVCEQTLVTHDRAELRTDKMGRQQFRILGRIDNVIDTGGIKVQIEEVEALLRPHLQAPFMITRAADARLGEAIVLLTEDQRTEQVQQIAAETLPRYWQPRHILAVNQLPMTATGKPARAQAQQLAHRLLAER